MATVTPNFNWPVPTSTDLVKDGATAIEALGDSIDASLVDLKGGTTGQVLAKATNTDMDFSWVAQDDSNAIQNSIVDAKGDLIAATANDTPARLAVGNNGETLVADSSTATGLRYQGSYPAGKNLLINGLLDIWQRSTSVTGQANGYATVDRWYLVSSASCTFAQETSVVPAGCRYSQKVTVGGSASSIQAYQAVETSNAIAYAGQSLTFSGRFQSSVTPTIALNVEYSTTVDYPLASGGWVTITPTSGGSGTAGSSSFTTISGVYAIPSTAKSLRFSFYSSSMASGAILYYGGFQAELGVVVTSLVRNGATIQGELAACQRYYWRSSDTNAFANYGVGYADQTNSLYASVKLPVSMRVKPTSVDYSTLSAHIYNVSATALSVVTLESTSLSRDWGVVLGSASGLTQFRPYGLNNNNSTSGYIGFSAEL